MTIIFRIFSVISLIILADTSWGGTTLFSNGKSDWTIFISAAPAGPEKFAAEEMQRIIFQMAHTRIPIKQSNSTPAANGIIIGSLGSSTAVDKMAKHLKLQKSEEEQIAIYTLNGNIYLAGNNPRSTLFCVYEFLRNQLGVRWLWYGESGEFIPQLRTYKLPTMSYNFSPSFKYRQYAVGWYPTDKVVQLWQIRNGLNTGCFNRIQDETDGIRVTQQHMIGIEPKYFKEHPEYFCLINGKRSKIGTSGCWSNEDFFKLQIEKCLKKLAEGWDMIAIFPHDVCVRCECEKCVAIDSDPSTRWWKFYLKLIGRLKKEYPKQKFFGIAYQEYRAVPNCDTRQFIEYVQYCMYNRCWIHKVYDKKCGINCQYRKEMAAWRKKGNMSIYGYCFDIFKASKSAYLPFWNMLKDQVRYFKDSNIDYVMTEVPPYRQEFMQEILHRKEISRDERGYTKYRIALYIYARLLWNANLTVDEILSDWCKTAYGPAATQMLNYHKLMANAWDNMNTCITYFHNTPTGLARYLLNDSTAKKASALLDAAGKIIQKDKVKNTRYLKEVRIEKKLFDEWVKYYSATKQNANFLQVLKTGINNVPKHYLVNKDGKKSSSYTQFVWTDKDIRIKVFCDAHGEYKKGSSANVWNDCDNVEIFLTGNDGQGYKQFAVNPAGGKYDGANWNDKWEGVWSAAVQTDKTHWSVEVVIPFSNFKTAPKPGDVWHLTVNYTSSNRTVVGFPFISYHDSSSGADIIFCEQKKEKKLIWLSGEKSHLDWYKLGLLQEGFCPEIFTYKDAGKVNLENIPLIVLYCYISTGIKQGFFDEKLIKAVKNGAVVVFNIGVIAPLDKYFGDKELKIENCKLDMSDKTVVLDDKLFFKLNRQTPKDYPWNGQGAFLAANPTRWKALTKQMTLKHGLLPTAMYTKYGKGMIVVAKSIRERRNDLQVAKFLNGLLSLNDALNKEKGRK